MSGKRFSWKTEKLQHSDDEVLLVVDNENKDWKGHILNIVDKLNEQQATISQLKEENEQLRKELNDCEKFRYTVFKRLNEEYIKECSIK